MIPVMVQSANPASELRVFDLITVSRREYIRKTAACALRKYFRLSECPGTDDDLLQKLKAGVFVTIKENGDLRGCIGFVTPPTGFLQTVREAAVMAATEDPRFLPVTADDLERIELEITILGSPKPFGNRDATSLKSLEIGKHGLIVESPFGRGLLLPQVALEWGFGVEEFLEATCIKAGLKRDCWKDPGNKIFYFDALSF